MKALGVEFFAPDTLEVAQNLLGCELLFDGCGGVIVETEAYKTDDASHYVMRRHKGRALAETYGQVYVYMNYGMYYLLNFTTEKDGIGAVLIRALKPTKGIDKMTDRRNGVSLVNLINGPGKICRALGIDAAQNGERVGESITLRDRTKTPVIAMSTRFGINRATELPWRFYVKGSRFVGKRPSLKKGGAS